MSLYAIHLAWVDGHATKAPVGIWAEGGIAYYPPETESFRSAGMEAKEHPAHFSWREWVEMRTEFGSTYGASWEAVESPASMESVLTARRVEFFSVEHPVSYFESPIDQITSGNPGASMSTAPAISVTRVEMPQLNDLDHEELEAYVGGQWEWCWANALPYRALAAPQVGAPMPAAPRSGVDFMRYVGYWNSLQGFLTYSFGWTRHDRGLRWWYDNDKPVDDIRFALLKAVWENDGNLMAYMEWCHDRLETFGHQALAEWTLYDGRPDELSRAWLRAIGAAQRRDVIDGTTPHGKHLEGGGHNSGPADSSLGGATLVISDHANRGAIYAAGSAVGWYRGLVERGAELPTTGNRSWRVDVYVRPIGFIGTYRRSRRTGLWFAGRHRYHSVGN